MFETYFPPAGHTDAAAVVKSSTGEEDTEIAALEARLAALKKAKAAGKKPEDTSEHVTGAVFRDALLLALGDRKVSAAQMQSFFVKQRKASAKEALAAVSSFAAELEEREKENNAEEAAKKEAAEQSEEGPKEPPTSTSDSASPPAPASQPSASTGSNA